MQPQILVAEDNTINQHLVKWMLERAGYSYRMTFNGTQLLEAYREARPQLILMDIQMPEMDGLTATSEIRKIEKSGGPRTIIIAITAKAMGGDEEMCLEAGMDDYLSKPFGVNVLTAKLAKWLPAKAA